MFLFLRLVLAHLLADFPLQTGQIYKKKIESSWGQLLHALIIVMTITAFSWPYLGYQMMWFLVLVFILLHTAIDMIKVEITNRLLPGFWSFLLDQALHIISLTLILFFSFSREAPRLNHPLVNLYNNDAVVVVLIGYIVSCFTGTYLLDTFQKTFLPNIASKNIPKMINAGVIERLLITTIFCFLKIYLYPVVFFLFFIRIIYQKKGVIFDFLLNLFYAGIIGILLKIFILRGL